MIKRDLFYKLRDHLPEKEMTFVVGPRQAGKTTLLLLLKDDLDKKGAKTVFLNLDLERDRRFFISQDDLVNKIQLEIGENHGYVFIDEIQRKENAGLFLKGIYDMNLSYKFIVSGSGSLELKEKIHESLAGRKLMFELSTMTFSEFVNFKTDYKYEDKLRDFFEIDTIKTQQFLKEYLEFGGYPRVVLSKTSQNKRAILDEIFQSYLERDITYLLGVTKREEFTNLVKVMASQVGNLTNYSELSSTLGLSVQTVKHYLWYLEKTFIIARIMPFHRNFRKEITHAPIFYFYDLGLRNYALKEFGDILISGYSGYLFQNFVYQLLYRKLEHSAASLHFWRTQDKTEVDFIVDAGRKIIPIEVKYKSLKTLEIARSLRSFIDKYHPQEAFIIHLGERKEMVFKRTKIIGLPFYELLVKSFQEELN